MSVGAKAATENRLFSDTTRGHDEEMTAFDWHKPSVNKQFLNGSYLHVSSRRRLLYLSLGSYAASKMIFLKKTKTQHIPEGGNVLSGNTEGSSVFLPRVVSLTNL